MDMAAISTIEHLPLHTQARVCAHLLDQFDGVKFKRPTELWAFDSLHSQHLRAQRIAEGESTPEEIAEAEDKINLDLVAHRRHFQEIVDFVMSELLPDGTIFFRKKEWTLRSNKQIALYLNVHKNNPFVMPAHVAEAKLLMKNPEMRVAA